MSTLEFILILWQTIIITCQFILEDIIPEIKARVKKRKRGKKKRSTQMSIKNKVYKKSLSCSRKIGHLIQKLFKK